MRWWQWLVLGLIAIWIVRHPDQAALYVHNFAHALSSIAS